MTQSQMELYNGLAPGLNSSRQIDDIAFRINVVAKTAAYTVTADESGTLFTTLGATAAVTFTLPAVADGLVYWFMNAADIDMVVAGAANDLIVTFNNATADSVSLATSSEKIGGGFMMVCDGTYWHCLSALAGNTLTVTDA